MKTIATLALIMALFGFPAGNANADIFTLWDRFPQSVNPTEGFGIAGVAVTGGLLTPLDNTDPYSFSRAGVEVKRGDTIPWGEPWIFMQPSSDERAALFGLPPEPYTIDVNFQFYMTAGTSANVTVGTADITDLDYPVYTPLFYYNLYLTDPTVTSSLLGVSVDATHALVFVVAQGSDDPQVYLQGTINDNVPVPASLLLFGSGLLGLAGWRRRPWLK